ncbi:TlpA family protein disulfide reductase [Cryptosporangium phraense]|uniref:TlpA family protein disulfide reductase n=1 Tax=Cryptosporangium phraense TaxID=2593070 RepID=UPI00147918A0|nr:TlpA disulfide reductase family protein [Cryptosporangium phraense]
MGPVRVLVVVVLLLAGCSSGGGGKAEESPTPGWNPSAFADSKFAACPAATGPVPGGSPLRSVKPLLCMVKTGDPVTVGAPIGRPMVLNLWASWCLPCKDEMPVMEHLSTAAGARLAVVGVNTGDDAPNAILAADDVGVTFPNVYDRAQDVLHALKLNSLPATAFISADGEVVHVYRGTPLTDKTLSALVEQHLGVRVA